MPKRRSSPCPNRNLARSAQLAFATAFWLLACGAADHGVAREAEDAGADQAEVNSGVNVCPLFVGSLVMPQRIGPGQTSSIVVRATDPDAPDSLLTFAWSAASGSFSASNKPTTNYRCAELGSQQLTCTAEDQRGCVSTLNVSVECVAN